MTVPMVDWRHRALALLAESSADSAHPASRPLGLVRSDDNVEPVDEAMEGSPLDASIIVRSAPRMPRVFEHHDCGPWNFYRTPTAHLVAFDWDNANPEGVPGFDFVQALAYVGFAIDGAFGTRRFAESFARRKSGRIASLLPACRERYVSEVGLDDAALCAVRLFASMRLSNDEIEARHEQGRPLRSRELERSMLGMWVAEARSTIDGC